MHQMFESPLRFFPMTLRNQLTLADLTAAEPTIKRIDFNVPFSKDGKDFQ
jgi:hypothetical protein